MRRLGLFGVLALAPSCLLLTSLSGLEGAPLVEDGGATDDGGRDDGGPVEDGGARDDGDVSVDAPLDAPDAGPSAEGAADVEDAPHVEDAPEVEVAPDVEEPDVMGPAPVLFQTTSGIPRGIALSATHVYWAEADPPGLLRAPKGSSNQMKGVHLEDLADNLADPFDIAVDDTHLYWTELGTSNTVWRKPLSGGPDAGSKTSYLVGPGRTEYLALGPGQAYVTASFPFNAVVFGPIGCCTSDVLYPGQVGVSGLSRVGDTAYWSVSGSKLIAGAISGPRQSTSTIASVAGVVSGVAADAQNIYWMSDGRNVMGMNLSSRQPQVFLAHSSDDLGAGDVAVDADHIYFTAPLRKAIFVLARPAL